MIHRFSTSDEASRLVPSQSKLSARSDIEREHPLIQLYDPESKDHVFAGSISEEIVNICGADVIVYVRTNSEAYDDVYEEDPDPTYAPGKRLKAYFVPKQIAANLTIWGLDVENQTTVIFNREQVYREFGDRMIRIGDIIDLPYNAAGIKPDRYRVLNAADAGNFRYNWQFWACTVENITHDITIDVDNEAEL